MNENQPRRHLITPIVVFGITALIAVVMLLWALVIWLAQLTGSMIWATLILGGVFALIALIVYLVSVRPAVQYISDQLDNNRRNGTDRTLGLQLDHRQVEQHLVLRSRKSSAETLTKSTARIKSEGEGVARIERPLLLLYYIQITP